MRVLGWPAFKDRDLNPYAWLLYSHVVASGVVVEECTPQRLLRGGYDIWHLHWPEHFFSRRTFIEAFIKADVLLRLIDWARVRNTKTVWTIHNLWSHESLHPDLESRFWKAFIPKIDGYISLSKAGMEMALERFPVLRGRPGFIVPHGHYRAEYPNNLTRGEARDALGVSLSARVLTYVGLIRLYKNLPQLIRAFRRVRDPEAILFITGPVNSPELADTLVKEATSDPRIRLRMNFVPKDELQTYLLASDLVVLPYKEILNSGSALLALSFDRPLLVPLLGSLLELQALVGKEWVRTYTGEITEEVIDEALHWAMSTSRPSKAPLEAFDWGRIAQQTIDAYRTITA